MGGCRRAHDDDLARLADRLRRRSHAQSPSPGENPGVLAAATLTGVHDQFTLGERDPGQSPGQHLNALTVVDGEGSQVDVARHESALEKGGDGRELDDRLGDPATGIRPQAGPEPVEGRPVGAWPDDQALAT